MVEYLQHAEVDRPHPFVLLLGERHNFSQAFVIYGQALEQASLLKAVDVCFKAFYCFDISYPKQCSPAWEFLQHVVYEVAGNESPSPNVRIKKFYFLCFSMM
ncbi:UNVERIFIED_CONTAM: hypothetical protein FKN15_040416 [Acipenser sinensis]